jgi:hypothetical protein
MFSSTLKRPAATLAVVAGLLAAAVPASAQGGGADFTRLVDQTPQGIILAGTGDDQMKIVASPRAAAYVLPWLWDNQTNVTWNPGIGDDL